MKVTHVKQVAGSPVLPFVHKAWGALMEDGQWSKTDVLINGAESCVIAWINRKPVGCLVYRIVEGDQVIVVIAYVEPKHRGKGVYQALHDLCEGKAKAAGGKVLLNICLPTNTGIQKTVEKLGYELYSQEWRKKL